MSTSTESVVVGLRVRPLLERDLSEGARECLRKVAGEPQVVLGADRAFTFNHVFDPKATQGEIFDGCIRPIIESVLDGYNATILAYGQTGSGKTHTMGSSYSEEAAAGEDAGLIPRAIAHLFEIAGANPESSVSATATFIEIYKEEVHDLLTWKENAEGGGSLATLAIRENAEGGGLTLTGQQSKEVKSVEDAMGVLADGARNRATGATAMNATSSRSHAIFTMSLSIKLANGKTFAPKLHFVDLAGSERAKRTGASGERLQEGIQINKGLLALGNVINALCERHSHVPYRDSKLTRLLQDSLGGNSRTVMLACVSPGDTDMEETLNTLKYANRARQIRNKPLLAQDPTQARIGQLMEQITLLQARLAHYEGGGEPLPPLAQPDAAQPTGGGAVPVPNGENGHAAGGATDGATNSVLLRRVTQLQKENETLRARMSSLLRVPTSSGASAGSAEAGGGALMALDSARSIGEDEEGATSHRSSSGSASDVAVAGGLSAAEDCAYAQEAMDLELEFLQKQGELSEELEGLNASLALKQALLAAQPSSDNAASSDDEVAVLCETLASLENKLKDVETERDAFHRQVSELRMHSDGQGQPSKMASRKLEALEAEISRLKKQRSQQEALLKARQASDQRVKQLEGEIDNIKAQKVQITRRQREEAETHRAQRSAREREMVQLRRKGDKQAAHVAKLEGANAKQAMVLKRKNEEIERLAAAQKKQRGTEGIVHRRPAFGPGGGQAAPLDRPSSAGRPAFGHGAGPAAPLDRPSTGGLPSARKPNVGGVTAPTQASQNRLEGKREDDIQKAVGVMTSRPREWLDTELKAIVEQQKIREQVNVQIEMRRQAAISLRALEMRAEQSADEPMEIEGGEDLARNAARAAEAETLRLKVQHHSTQVGMLQAKLVRNNESAEATTEKKFEALRDIKDAKALLKASLPQLVSLKLSLEKKEQMLTSQKGSLEDATDLANGLRLQLMRERKVAEERAKESTHALVQAQNELKELQGSISQQPPPPPPEPERPAESDKDGTARLDERLAKIKGTLSRHEKNPTLEEEGEEEGEEEEEEGEEDTASEESEAEEEGEEDGARASDDDYFPTPTKVNKAIKERVAVTAAKGAAPLSGLFDGADEEEDVRDQVKDSVAHRRGRRSIAVGAKLPRRLSTEPIEVGDAEAQPLEARLEQRPRQPGPKPREKKIHSTSYNSSDEKEDIAANPAPAERRHSKKLMPQAGPSTKATEVLMEIN